MVMISPHMSGGNDKPRVYTLIRNKSFVTVWSEHCHHSRLLADEVLKHPASYVNLGEGNSLLRTIRKSKRISDGLPTPIVLSLSGTDLVTPTRACISCSPWNSSRGFHDLVTAAKTRRQMPQDERQRNTAVDWGNIKKHRVLLEKHCVKRQFGKIWSVCWG